MNNNSTLSLSSIAAGSCAAGEYNHNNEGISMSYQMKDDFDDNNNSNNSSDDDCSIYIEEQKVPPLSLSLKDDTKPSAKKAPMITTPKKKKKIKNRSFVEVGPTTSDGDDEVIIMNNNSSSKKDGVLFTKSRGSPKKENRDITIRTNNFGPTPIDRHVSHIDPRYAPKRSGEFSYLRSSSSSSATSVHVNANVNASSSSSVINNTTTAAITPVPFSYHQSSSSSSSSTTNNHKGEDATSNNAIINSNSSNNNNNTTNRLFSPMQSTHPSSKQSSSTKTNIVKGDDDDSNNTINETHNNSNSNSNSNSNEKGQEQEQEQEQQLRQRQQEQEHQGSILSRKELLIAIIVFGIVIIAAITATFVAMAGGTGNNNKNQQGSGSVGTLSPTTTPPPTIPMDTNTDANTMNTKKLSIQEEWNLVYSALQENEITRKLLLDDEYAKDLLPNDISFYEDLIVGYVFSETERDWIPAAIVQVEDMMMSGSTGGGIGGIGSGSGGQMIDDDDDDDDDRIVMNLDRQNSNTSPPSGVEMTPNQKATAWLLFHDEMKNPNESVWRWAIVSMYYKMNGQLWKNINFDNWFISNTSLCTWERLDCGISINQLTPVEIDFHELNIIGEIPIEFTLLGNSLRSIELKYNRLYGTIPANVFQSLMPTLGKLYLDNNALTGTVPIELGGLDTLYVQNNALTGDWPESFCYDGNAPIDSFGVDCDKVECLCCGDMHCYYSM